MIGRWRGRLVLWISPFTYLFQGWWWWFALEIDRHWELWYWIILHRFKWFHPVTFPWKAIWGAHAPRRVSFFAWAATWGRILTTDNLKRRGYQLVGRCCMCRCNEETISHLLLHCEVAHGLWNFVFRSFGIVWVLPRSVHDLFSDGVTGWGRIILRFGIWFLLAFSGPYGKNKIIVLLRMRSARGLNFMNYFLILCMIGLQFEDSSTPNLSFLF